MGYHVTCDGCGELNISGKKFTIAFDDGKGGTMAQVVFLCVPCQEEMLYGPGVVKRTDSPERKETESDALSKE
jgi:RNase P subunit RPR2